MESITFEEIYKAWKSEKALFVKESSMATYTMLAEKHLLPVFRNATEISEADGQALIIQMMERGLSHKTAEDAIIVLRMIIRFADKRNWWRMRPWDLKYPPRRSKPGLTVLSPQTQRQLMKYLSAHYSLRNLGIQICLNTGIRIGEICGLRWSDINLQERTISISRTVSRVYSQGEDGERRSAIIIGTPKTETSFRVIPISSKLAKLLESPMRYSDKDNYMLSNKSVPVEPRSYREHFNRLLRELGLPHINFHSLRHTFATRCIESHCDVKTVSSILGHSDVSTTLNVYVHPNMEHKRKCIDQMLRALDRDDSSR